MTPREGDREIHLEPEIAFFFFLMFIYLYWEEENKWEKGREKGGERESQAGSALRTEPHSGLDLTMRS